MQSGRSDDVRKEVLEVMGCRHTYYKRRGRKHGRRGHDTRRHYINVRRHAEPEQKRGIVESEQKCQESHGRGQLPRKAM